MSERFRADGWRAERCEAMFRFDPERALQMDLSTGAKREKAVFG